MSADDFVRCDVCGRFISYTDLYIGWAVHRMITPESDRSTEEWETLCHEHKDKPE